MTPTFPAGMLLDGQKPDQLGGMAGRPPFVQPCVWFPYGKMSQSASEPVWDTTHGKFGPFEGQCFVGDQTNSNIMRVDLQKMASGRYQGACFMFREGFECGVNRLAFGPDGSLYAGMTSRGWGARGGKMYGLQRVVYTGIVPFEILSMKLTKGGLLRTEFESGFDLTFTKPLDDATVKKLEELAKATADAAAGKPAPPSPITLSSFTYLYSSGDATGMLKPVVVPIMAAKVSADRKTVALTVPVDRLRPGRVYEVHVDGVRSAEGETVLHPEGFYTLNELPAIER
jgi:hypothetical protein